MSVLVPAIAGPADDIPKARATPIFPQVLPAPLVACQAQLDPTLLSVLNMLLPAVCTFWPCALACS